MPKINFPENKHCCLHTWFEAQATATPLQTALIFEDRVITYRQLNESANRVAHQLIARGAKPGDLIGLCLERGPNLIVGLLGILKAGAAYAPLDPSLPESRLRFLLDDMNTQLVVSHAELATRFHFSDNQFLDVDAVLSQDNAGETQTQNPVTTVTADDLAYIIYTSGSTGKPKGVLVTHGNVSRLFTETQPWFNFDQNDTWTLFHSFAFDFSVWEIWGALLYGGKLVIVPYTISRSPLAFYQLMSRHQVTVLNQTPSAFRQLMRADEELHLSHPIALRYVIFGGEALEFSSLRPWVQRHGDQAPRLINMYGITETTVHVTYRPVTSQDIAQESSSCVGAPIPDLQLYLLDEQLNRLAPGTIGEIYVGGKGVARGYLNRPELTAERFIPDPFSGDATSRLYKTGDLGCFREDGELEYHGRSDRQVQLRGFRVELGEIESRLQDHPSIGQAIVVVRHDDSGVQQLIAYLVPRIGQEIQASVLRPHLLSTLPEYMVPQFFVAIESIPLTGNGKLDVEALPLPSRSIPSAQGAQPKSAAEVTIAEVWKKLLRVDRVNTTSTFFELGGQSLLLPEMERQLQHKFPHPFTIVDLFQYPTIAKLAAHLTRSAKQTKERNPRLRPLSDPTRITREDSQDVAIIGMAGRFPGANSVQQFWANLKQGVESIRTLTTEELLAAGVAFEMIKHPRFVPVTASLDDVRHFDAEFFGVSPYEATITDPQHRLFLECSWTALEDAGYDPAQTDRRIGVFAGSRPNSYRELVHQSLGQMEPSVALQTLLANEKDFLATRIAHRLDLRGPSLTVQTGCSTSMVAVQLACQSLLTYQCNMALAGGVSVNLEYQHGYLFEEGMILSPDGHVRAFDDRARGSVFGEGVGIVVLKRLAEALADGDTIHAVIKAVAINNDGASKISFAAPSIEGQADVIRLAHAMSHRSADDFGFVETHGTGTYIGDPVEITALTQAFQESTSRTQFCAIGSVKTNVGHLDVAAGITGLMKTALVVRDGVIPPSLHFETPNQNIDFKSSPFFVATETQPFPRSSNSDEQGTAVKRRLAGVSSFGVGGTNAHAIIEQAPESIVRADDSLHQPSSASSALPHLLLLSARSEEALVAAASNLQQCLEHSEVNLADVAYTLQVGRRAFSHRRAVICDNKHSAIEILSGENLGASLQSSRQKTGENDQNEVVFLFPGQGAQYPGMARQLYEALPGFRNEVDRLLGFLDDALQDSLRKVLFPAVTNDVAIAESLSETWLAQPALFIVEYALARTLIDCGVTPAAVVGHSIGEYAAACIADVFSVETALALVVERGRALHALPRGSMLSVSLNSEQVTARLPAGLSLAAVNSPGHCVVSGPTDLVEPFAKTLAGESVHCQLLQTSHAFHSAMTEPAIKDFVERVAGCERSSPQIPMISTVTGDWVQGDEICDPNYWGNNIRQPVRFSEAAERMLAEPNRVCVEVGPGKTLGTLLKAHPQFQGAVINTLRHPQQDADDVNVLARSLAEIWLAGGVIDWAQYHAHQPRRRISLPTYPFQRKLYWATPFQREASSTTSVVALNEQPDLLNAEIAAALPQQHNDFADWFYVPRWRRAVHAEQASRVSEDSAGEQVWLVFAGQDSASDHLCTALAKSIGSLVRVETGNAFQQIGPDHFSIDPENAEHYDRLWQAIAQGARFPDKILHLWTWGSKPSDSQRLERLPQNQALGLYSLQRLAQALGRVRMRKQLELVIVSSGLQAIESDDVIIPEQATLLGAFKVIPLEYPKLHCRLIDSPADSLHGDAIVRELFEGCTETMVALRRGERWLPEVDRLRLDQTFESMRRLRTGGTYLITGGLGGIGFCLARFLATKVGAKLVLLGRSEMPERESWQDWLASHRAQDRTSEIIRRLQELESLGGEVLYCRADSANLEQMQSVIQQAVARFGTIHGVIHAAGEADNAGAIQLRTTQATERVLASKVRGTLNLDLALAGHAPDFWVLCSSISNWLYHNRYAQLSYVAGNSFLDAFAAELQSRGQFAVSIAWDEWQDVGMAAEVARDFAESFGVKQRLFDPLDSFSPAQGEAIFHRVVSCDASQVLISTRDLPLRIQLDVHAKSPFLEAARLSANSFTGNASQKPAGNSFDTPRESIERTPTEEIAAGNLPGHQRISQMWRKLLGLSHVGPDDNYFDLGGDSLNAVRFLTECEREFGEKLPFATMVAFPTPKKLAQYLELDSTQSSLASTSNGHTSESAKQSNGLGDGAGSQLNIQESSVATIASSPKLAGRKLSNLIEISPSGQMPPLFLMHAADGYTLVYQELAKRLDPDLPIFGVQSCGLQGDSIDSIEAMARQYVADIQQRFPHGPYLIAGYCMGGTVALEVAQQLIAKGERVDLLACMETYNWHTSQAANHSLPVVIDYYWQKLQFHTANFLCLDSTRKRQFLREKWSVLKRRRMIWLQSFFSAASRSKSMANDQGLLTNAQLWSKHDEAAEAYLPREYPGEIVCLRAKRDYRRYQDRPFNARRGVVECRLPVYPAGMMVEPFVDELARRLMEHIYLAVAKQKATSQEDLCLVEQA